jgi:hypothetical protein
MAQQALFGELKVRAIDRSRGEGAGTTEHKKHRAPDHDARTKKSRKSPKITQFKRLAHPPTTGVRRQPGKVCRAGLP